MAKTKGGAFQGMLLDKITLDDATELVTHLDPEISLMFHGPPGIGKTAWSLNTPILQPALQFSLTTRQPEDVGGCPSIDHEKKVTRMNPPELFHQLAITSENPDPEGSMLFDEVDKARDEVTVTMMRILSERSLEGLKFGKRVRFILCANRREDAAGAFHELPKVIRNRLVHYEITPNLKQWERDFAIPNGIHPFIMGFLDKHVDEFCNYQPSQNDYGFPTPRSWENASGIVYAGERGLKAGLVEASLRGCVGPGALEKYKEYQRYINDVPDLDQLAEGKAPFPEQGRADRWVALVSRCVAAAEQELNKTPPDYTTLKQVCKILVNMPEHAANYKLLLATYLQRRPATSTVWLDVDKMGADHCASLGDVIMKLQGQGT